MHELPVENTSSEFLSLIALRRNAYVLAASAFVRAFPKAKLLGGFVTDSGFCYDFVYDHPLTCDIFPILEEHIRSLRLENPSIRSQVMVRENAQEMFRYKQEPFRAMNLEDGSQFVSLLQLGEFFDACPEPHLNKIKDFPEIAFLSIEEIVTPNFLPKTKKNYRLEGTAFHSKSDLKDFCKKLKQLSKHNHISWAMANNALIPAHDGEEQYWIEGEWLRGVKNFFKTYWENSVSKKEFHLVESPILQPKKWFDSYKLEVKNLIINNHRVLRTSFFPSHAHLYQKLDGKTDKIGEFGTQFAENTPNSLQGLLRINSYDTDTQHIFCKESEVLGELISSLQFIEKTITIFKLRGFWVLREYGEISKKNSKKGKNWAALLEEALNSLNKSLTRNDGTTFESLDKVSFAGSRLEYHFLDEWGRSFCGPHLGIWNQMPKLNNSLPKEVKQKGKVDAVIQYSIFGSIERLIALCLEKGRGLVPYFMLPEQVRVIPILKKNAEYGNEILAQCLAKGLRAKIDNRDLTLAEKMKLLKQDLVGYGIIIGDKERQLNKISVRSGITDEEFRLIDKDEFLTRIEQESQFEN